MAASVECNGRAVRLSGIQHAVVCGIVGLAAGAWLAQASARGSPPSTAPSTFPAVGEADRLAAGSLRRSATSLVYAPADTPARAARMVALARMADRLAPGEEATNRLLAGVYQAQGKTEWLAKCLDQCLRDSPQDHLLGQRWLRLNLDRLNTSEQRLGYLTSFVEQSRYPAALQAKAWAQTGAILRGQGETAAARKAFESALRLDPYDPEAIQGDMALRKDANALERVRAALAILRGNPGRAELAVQAATALEEMGLYVAALSFFEHAWEMADLAGDRDFQYGYVASRYCNAMLAAKDNKRAVNTFTPILGFTDSADLRSLLIEAHQALQETARANALIGDMEKSLRSKEGISTAPPTLERDLAWFYEHTVRRPADALTHARRADANAGDDPVVMRILGIAELLCDDPNEGVTRLAPLVRSDAYAAKFLAEYYYGKGHDPNAAKAVLLEGVAAGRSGPAYRELAALAALRGVEIPPIPGAQEAQALVDQFDRRYLEMARAPDKFVSIRLQPVKDRPRPGEPIEVTAVLANLSEVEIPLGDWGLFNPRMSLEVETAVAGVKERFGNLPVVIWPAPRYLPVGGSLSVREALDVGTLGRFLDLCPLEAVSLTVIPMLDPIQRGNRFFTSEPNATVAPIVITREAITGPVESNSPADVANACHALLGHLVYDLKNGDLPARMRAAGQVASLLTQVRRIEQGRERRLLPTVVAEALSRPVLLRIVVELLGDPSDVVRAEMVSQLGGVPLDDKIVSLLAPVIEDRSPVVRLRLAELLGACGLPGQGPVLELLSRDRDDLVRAMALAMRARPK